MPQQDEKRLLIIFAHPKQQSLCHEILNQSRRIATEQGYQVRVRDLYKIDFNPLLDERQLKQLKEQQRVDPDVEDEQQHISWADTLIFIYPIWWHDRPAILKGWFDRVFTYGFAFEYGPSGRKGLLTNKRALVIQTTGHRKQNYLQGYGHVAIHAPIRHGALEFSGITTCHIHTCYDLHRAASKEIGDSLLQIQSFLKQHLSGSVA